MVLSLGKKKGKKKEEKIDLASGDSFDSFDDEIEKLDEIMSSDAKEDIDFVDDNYNFFTPRLNLFQEGSFTFGKWAINRCDEENHRHPMAVSLPVLTVS